MPVIDETVQEHGGSYPCKSRDRSRERSQLPLQADGARDMTGRTAGCHRQMLPTTQIALEGLVIDLGRGVRAGGQSSPYSGITRSSRQFHGKVKTDLDLERLPSGKFATSCTNHGAGLL